MDNSILKISKLHPEAIIPERATPVAAGLDLFACLPDKKFFILYGERVLIPTGISVSIPDGYYGRIAPRSGLALKSGFDVLAGVIDQDYRGELKVMLGVTTSHNLDISSLKVSISDVYKDTKANDNFVIKHGTKIAQLIIEKIVYPKVEIVDNLDNTVRGDGGFGSTGI